MERTEALSTRGPGLAIGNGTACPRCGEPIGPLPPVTTSTLGGRPIFRCSRCGTRGVSGAAVPEMIFTCESCGLPFVSQAILPHGEHRCTECRSGAPPAGLPDPAVVVAAEAEIRSALGARWRLVTASGLSGYLDRIARLVAQRFDGAPAGVRVVLVDDAALKTLALPSGTLLVSVGTLAFLEDEAELVFVLGHELAHAVSEDAAVRLVRLGFHAVSRGGNAPEHDTWAGAAMDLVRLGYGRRRERDADLRALEVLLALRYDPGSALRYLGRLRTLIERGDPDVAELASAHPPPDDRMRRLEKTLYGRVRDDAALRVNREVYRRAAGREALTAPMAPCRLAPAPIRSEFVREEPRRHWIWIATAAAVVAVAVGLLLLLAR